MTARNRIKLAQDMDKYVCCYHGNESAGSIQRGEILE